MTLFFGFAIIFACVFGISAQNNVVSSNTYPLFKCCMSGSNTFSFQVQNCYGVNITMYDGLYNPTYRMRLNLENDYTEFLICNNTNNNWNCYDVAGIGISACRQFRSFEVSWTSQSLIIRTGGLSISNGVNRRTNQLLYHSVSSGPTEQGSLKYIIQDTGRRIVNLYNILFNTQKLMCPLSECDYLRDTTLNQCQLSYGTSTPVCRSGNVYIPPLICTALRETCNGAKLTIFGCFALNTCARCDVIDVGDRIRNKCQNNSNQAEIRIATVDSCSLFTQYWPSYFFISYTEGTTIETATKTFPATTTAIPATTTTLPLTTTTFRPPTTTHPSTTTSLPSTTTSLPSTTTTFLGTTTAFSPSTTTITSTYGHNSDDLSTINGDATQEIDSTTIKPNPTIIERPDIIKIIGFIAAGMVVISLIITATVIICCAKRRSNRKSNEKSHLENNKYENGNVSIENSPNYIQLQLRCDSHKYGLLGERTHEVGPAAQHYDNAENSSQNYTQLNARPDSHKYDIIRQLEQLNRNRIYDYVDTKFNHCNTHIPNSSITSKKSVHEYLELH